MISLDKSDRFENARRRMLKHDLAGRDITDSDVLRVMEQIPRQQFVPQAYQAQSYADGPLPVDKGQTISQPYIVALMTQKLRLNPDCDVLEIGTGTGYQTAVLSRLAKKVYSVERFSELSKSAQEVLAKLDINNVEFQVGDGSYGWPEARLFDRIIVTAAVPEIPQPLLKQLKEKGIIIAPVGYGDTQELIVAEKSQTGKVIETFVCGCRFVKLIGAYGFKQ